MGRVADEISANLELVAGASDVGTENPTVIKDVLGCLFFGFYSNETRFFCALEVVPDTVAITIKLNMR